MSKRHIEIFSAGCFVCDEAVNAVRALACPSCEVTVHDLGTAEGRERATGYGIRAVPAVVVDGQLASCCQGRGLDAAALKALGVGQVA